MRTKTISKILSETSEETKEKVRKNANDKKKKKMKNIKDLTVKVTYEVGLGGLEMPIEVYNEIQEADENGDEIDGMSSAVKYLKASEWLGKNIQERDCMEWKAEVIELREAE